VQAPTEVVSHVAEYQQHTASTKHPLENGTQTVPLVGELQIVETAYGDQRAAKSIRRVCGPAGPESDFAPPFPLTRSMSRISSKVRRQEGPTTDAKGHRCV